MKKQIEVEVRGRIENFENTLNNFKNKAKFLGEKERLSFVYFPSDKEVSNVESVREDPIDLKVRITSKNPEIVMKYGRWGSEENRRELLFPIEIEKFPDALDFLKYLGWHKGVLMDTKTYVFEYKDIEFALVKSGEHSYFEAEKLCENECEAEALLKEIKEACTEMNLKLFEEQEFIDFLNTMNERKDRLFNMHEKTFDEVITKFKEYF